MLTENIKKYFLPTLLVAAVLISLLKPSTNSINSAAVRIQNRLNEAEIQFNKKVTSDVFLENLKQGSSNSPLIEGFTHQGILLFYYRNDSLIHWTSSNVLPLASPSSYSSGTSFIKLKNGWYVLMKDENKSLGTVTLGLMAIKHEYAFENNFLVNDFAEGMNVPRNIELTDQKIEGSIPVRNIAGETLFSLYVSGEQAERDLNYLLFFAQLLILLLLTYYIHKFSVALIKKRSFITGFCFSALSLLAIRAIMLSYDLPSELYKVELFDPKYYASSVITKSLGDLTINCILLTWIIVLYSRYAKKCKEIKVTALASFIGIGVVFCFTGFVTWVFKTLVMDSVISFEVYNILSLNFYSLLGLICVALLLFCHFIITRTVLDGLQRSGTSSLLLIIFSVFCGLLFGTWGVNSEFYQSILLTAAWTITFVLVFYFITVKHQNTVVRNTLIIVSLYSILSTLLIENLYERKERNHRKFFSGKLISERDFVAEYLFMDVAKRIKSDVFIRNYFINPIIPQKEITDRLNTLYLGGYFNKYDFQLFLFDENGNPLKNEDSTHVSLFYKLFRDDTTGTATLHYVSDSALNYSYLSVLPVETDSQLAGTLALRMIPKIYYGQNVYPELLIGSNVTVSNNVRNYGYAIYQNNKIITQYGDYPYSYYWNREEAFDGSNFAFLEERYWEHNVQRFTNGKKVIVSVQREPLFEPVATFSYFFTFYFLLLGVALLVYRLFVMPNSKEFLRGNLIVSFRTRINYSMLIMILLSFIIIGLITISFFSRQYDRFYTDRLLRKEKVIHASLEYFIQKNSGDEILYPQSSNAELNLEIARLADINSIDINLFDRAGDLSISSQPAIYDRGILSRKINPQAYFELENNKATQIVAQEHVGALSYLATYTPLRNNKGEAVGYLGIPYFERSKNINDEVSSFLVALMNVYVFLLICAAVVAYFISNSITRPLTIISDKLRFLNLNKRNEPIEWNSKDEIGILVSEYNKMIKELEQSAQKLAKGERESAWREMAKQIAHEIKNPLTPMKLSIQYLQRAIDEGNPNIEQLACKVAKTLEEQIENLSSIASAFSSFAKMPKAQNEIINLNELLKSVTDLFNREEKITITFTTEAESPYVFADKNQLVSVFNNLIKNAIQSVPENRAGFIDVYIREEDGWIVTSVSDNGNGIPKENYERVFVPNFTTKSSGTGLGLAITKQIIDGAGGKIWFESAENVGSSFFVKLLKSKA